MKIFQRAGCGCIIIPVTENSEITVDYCGGEDRGLHFNSPTNSILPENRTKAVWLTESQHTELFGEINRLLALGRKFETLTQTLGIKS